MANNNKNKTPKKNILNNTSDQKENRPKGKATVKATNPNEGIAMSKQLLTKRRSKPANRVRTKKKPMPSLAELEKMFEDSDDDKPNLKHISTENISTAPENQPTTITNITQKGSVTRRCTFDAPLCQNYSLEPPQRKRSKSEADFEDCNDLPLVMISPTKTFEASGYKSIHQINITEQPLTRLTNEEKTSVINIETTSHINIITSSEQTSPDINIKTSSEQKTSDSNFKTYLEQTTSNINTESSFNGNLSDGSSDSNKTIDYQISPSRSQTESRMPTFSPLPSTSRDSQTFMKNDQLFNEIFKEINKGSSTSNVITTANLPQETENIKQSFSPNETIVIDDEIIKIEEPVINLDLDNDDNIQNTNLLNQNTSTNQIKIDDDDDDCVIIETETITPRQALNSSNIIDLDEEHTNNINRHIPATSECDDIIDVDSLIAENTSILEKFQKNTIYQWNPSQPVIDVEMSSAPENPRMTSETSNQNLTIPQPENLTNTSSAQSWCEQPTQQNEVMSVSVPASEHSRNVPNYNPSGSNSYTCTTNHHPCLENVLSTPHNIPIYHPSRQNRRNQIQMSVYGFFQNLMSGNQVMQNREILPFSLDLNTLPTPETTNSVPKNIGKSKKSQQIKKPTPQKNNVSPDDSLDSENSIGRLGECPICMETLSGRVIASTICGHIFCMRCLEKAVVTNRRCPTCRKILKKNGYHQIFL